MGNFNLTEALAFTATKVLAKITTLFASKGTATKPVYFDANGKPVACTYELKKTVPADAKFTDTTYGVATSSTAGLMSAADKVSLNNLSHVRSYTCSGEIEIGSFDGKPLYRKCWKKTETAPTNVMGTIGFMPENVVRMEAYVTYPASPPSAYNVSSGVRVIQGDLIVNISDTAYCDPDLDLTVIMEYTKA